MNRPITSRRFRESATLIRQQSGQRVNRRWVPGAETRTEITVVSAPSDAAKMRDLLPEGARLSESRTFWIEGSDVQPVRIGDNATEGDVIEYQDTRFRVQHVESWPGFVEVLGARE